MEFRAVSPLDVRSRGTNESQWIWQQLQFAAGPAFLLPGMGPGQAVPLPGCALRAGTAARVAGDRGTWRWEDSLVHRGGVAHLKGWAGSRAGTTLPGLPFLPEGGPEEYSALEVCSGPG